MWGVKTYPDKAKIQDVCDCEDEEVIKELKNIIINQKEEIKELNGEIIRRNKFIEELMMKMIDQAKPMQRAPSAVEAYMAKKDGASNTASVKEAQKSRLPG